MKKNLFILSALLVCVFGVFTVIGSGGGGGGGTDTTPPPGTTDDGLGVQGGGNAVPSGLTVGTVSGDVTACMTPTPGEMEAYNLCVAACPPEQDPLDCVMGCMSSSGMGTSGGMFTISITITNDTAADIEYILKAGTYYRPDSGDAQPMMIAYDVILIVTPGTDYYCIPVYCLASHKDAPDSSFTYEQGTVTLTCLLQIIAITETKDIENCTYTELTQIQAIIWKCTDGEEITVTDWAFLNGLPAL